MFSFYKNKKKNNFDNDENIELDMNNIPKHVAIIMDGNGRWAKQRNLPRTMGHKAGVETIRRIIKEGDRLGIKYITLYAFSTENWKRPDDEVSALMKLLVEYLRSELAELNRNGVVIKVLGDINKLPIDAQKEVNEAINITKDSIKIPDLGNILSLIDLLQKDYELDEVPDIFTENISESELGLLWNLDKEHNQYSFQNAFFYEESIDNEGNITSMKWTLSFEKYIREKDDSSKTETTFYVNTIKSGDNSYKISSIYKK